MPDSVPVPREGWGLSGPQCRGPRAASATPERPLFPGVPAVCCAGRVGKAAGTVPWYAVVAGLIDTLTGHLCGQGDRWAALTLWLPQKRAIMDLPIHSPRKLIC